jgi:hypothetical protein
MQDRYLKRLRKKAKRGMRGYPVATIAYYGPDLSRASKAAVGILAYEGGEPEIRSWLLETGDVRRDPAIAAEILSFIEEHGALSVAMSDGIIGCPHQEGVDYEGEWCPVCEFGRGRDRFTGERLQERKAATAK